MVHSKCEHGKIKSRYKECGGSKICEHNRRRSQCKDCGGSEVCEHGRIRYRCKDCGGTGICEHNKVKNECKECSGSQICQHGRRRDRCKDCGGNGMCEHHKRRQYCKDCGGSQICEHGRRRDRCKYLEGPRKRVHFSCVKAVPFLEPLICLKVAPGTQTGKSSCLCGGHLGGLVCSAWKLSSRPFLIGFCRDAASTVLNSKSLWMLAKILLRLFGANRRGTATTQIQSRNWCSGSKIC